METDQEAHDLSAELCAVIVKDQINTLRENLQNLETTLDTNCNDCVSIKELKLIEQFFMLVKTMRPRSLRHLETFLDAATDGDWLDAMIVVRDGGTEFRTIDKCSGDSRAEFGI